MATSSTVKQLLASLLLGGMTLQATAALVIRPVPADPHQHNRRAGKLFKLSEHQDARVTLLTPDLQSRELPMSNDRISFKPSGQDNYHVLLASRQHQGVQQTAIRYVYGFGKPTGYSPSQLTALEKAPLEIVPNPLPREHWHYRAGDRIAFVVRFQGVPIASTPVSLSTRHASILQAMTDTQGRVFFNLPDDFPETRPGRNNNPASELLVHSKYSENGKDYATWLSADYQADPRHWQHRNLGALVAGGGFIFGAFITGLGFRNNRQGGKK
jgi:hypothetical protein